MKDRWLASSQRMQKALRGSKRLDKVPYFPLVCEEMMTRVSGKTLKELINSPKTYANASINTHEFLQADTVLIPTAYAGPAEAYAFAEVNDKLDTIKWYDYRIFMIQQGAVCKTEEDIDKLELPEHSKSGLWKNLLEASKLVSEKTRFPQMCALGIWCVVQELRGTNAFRDMRRNPDLLLKLCEKVYQSQMDIYHEWIDKVGPSPYIFFTAYAFNSHMMSLEDAMKYEGQFIKRMQKEMGVPFIIHNCGTAPYHEEICREIDVAAINASHPLDIEFWIEFKKNHPKVTIMGATIDVSRELLNGTPNEIELKVKENIENLAPGGGYMCAPVCCLPWGVSMNNVMMLPELINKYGTYPINGNK